VCVTDDKLANEQEPRPSALPKIAAVAAVGVMLIIAQRFGIFRQFADPAHVKQLFLDLGPWGYVAFVVAYAMLQPFGLPGTVFVVAAPLIWPWPIAFALSMTGTMAASVVGFSFARFVARDWISSKIPERFRAYNERLAQRAFTTVFLLRLVFWMPPLLHAFFGVSRVRFWQHFWGSLAGYALPLFLVSFFGQKLFDVLKTISVRTWLEIAVGIAIAAVGYGLLRWRCSKRQPTESVPETSSHSK
jgi:uncharacterized membrane protein YdjX (TVP38/TMEM64 family)